MEDSLQAQLNRARFALKQALDGGDWTARRYAMSDFMCAVGRIGKLEPSSARLADFPAVPGIQVYTFRGTLPSGHYTMQRDSEVVPGWSPAPNTTFSTPVGPDAVVRP